MSSTKPGDSSTPLLLSLPLAVVSGRLTVVEGKIREAWQDFKEKKEDAYAALLADDFTAVEIDGKGPHDKKASVSEVKAGTLDRYSLSDLRITPLGADSALATYTANTDGTMPDGKEVHGMVAVTEVWVRRAGDWKALRYHESELRRGLSSRFQPSAVDRLGQRYDTPTPSA